VPRAGLTSARVAEAAADLADDVGLDGVTLTALAKHFGVATPSLYTHVRSSADVRTRVALLALDETAGLVADALAGVSGRSALAAVASAGPRHAELSRAALRGYALSGDDETHAVRLLGATFHGYAALDAAGAFSHGGPSAPASDDTWERVIDGLDTLLRSWETR
jgi:AcrR family transcriptional regulator